MQTITNYTIINYKLNNKAPAEAEEKEKKMTKTELTKWLIKQIRLIKITGTENNIENDIAITSFYHLNNSAINLQGTRKAAEILKIDLLEESWECNGSTAVRVSFKFLGHTFYELENYKERG